MNLTSDWTDLVRRVMNLNFPTNPCAEVELEGYRQQPSQESYSKDFWLETSSYLPQGL